MPSRPQVERDRQKAKQRALRRLAAAHPDEYREYENEEREAVGLPPLEEGNGRDDGFGKWAYWR